MSHNLLLQEIGMLVIKIAMGSLSWLLFLTNASSSSGIYNLLAVNDEVVLQGCLQVAIGTSIHKFFWELFVLCQALHKDVNLKNGVFWLVLLTLEYNKTRATLTPFGYFWSIIRLPTNNDEFEYLILMDICTAYAMGCQEARCNWYNKNPCNYIQATMKNRNDVHIRAMEDNRTI